MAVRTCKGSIVLGTGCGICGKCRDEIEGEIYSHKSETVPGYMGWTCPRCGRGNAPHTSTCPCIPKPPPRITY